MTSVFLVNLITRLSTASLLKYEKNLFPYNLALLDKPHVYLGLHQPRSLSSRFISSGLELHRMPMLTNEQLTLLANGAKLLKLELSEDHLRKIIIYLNELQRWAKIVDLVSQSDPSMIIRKHVLDSLAVLPCLPVYGRLLDLGSGAGFPGLPIAIVRQTLSISLLEPRRKRVNFLKEAIRTAALAHVSAY